MGHDHAAMGLPAFGGLGLIYADKPFSHAPDHLRTAQQQLRIAVWVTPVLTGALVALGAQQGEQQRPLAGLLPLSGAPSAGAG